MAFDIVVDDFDPAGSASQTASAARGAPSGTYGPPNSQPPHESMLGQGYLPGYSKAKGRQPATVVEPEGAGAGEAHPQGRSSGGAWTVVFSRVCMTGF